ncbi:MAG: hypothetical protein J0M08_01165 [Bacteroidetes bacterium]|nr:hypothetical protein [Bacteroidota bacterium]
MKMLEEFKKNITPQKFLKDCNEFKVEEKKTYYISYPEFIKYFQNLTEPIDKHNLIIGINFTYGWMPTILDFCSNRFEEAIQILNRAKEGKRPSVEELEILKELFNNSLVGTSKLLHFINPEKFAIWDSRVYRYLTKGQEPYQNRIGNAKVFLDYLTFCDSITQLKEYENVHKSICEKLGKLEKRANNMTKYRTVELIMYHNGGKIQKKVTKNNKRWGN